MKRPSGSYPIPSRPKLRLALASLTLTIAGFTGGCGGLGTSPTPPPHPDTQLNQSVNHIIFMVQENRGLDHYLGKLADLWHQNGYPSQQFDGLPANASNPTQDGTGTISSFHFRTVCMQNMSPGWNESHVDWNRTNPIS